MNEELDICTVVGCPMMCRYCPQDTFTENYKSDEKILSFKNFMKVIDKLPKKVKVAFAGLSEPFLNPDCAKMIKYADKHKHNICIYTTGVGMKLEDVDKIKNIKYYGFILHLPDSLKHSKIPATQYYLNLIKKIHKSKIKNLRTMCMAKPYKEFIEMFPKTEIIKIISRAGNLNIKNFPKTNRKKGKLSCGKDFKPRHVTMLPNGDVIICCNDYSIKHIIGNLFEQSWEDIFKSEEYKKIVKGLEDDKEDIICRYCEWGLRRKK